MRAVIQRVKAAEVRVDGQIRGSISGGLLVYAGVEKGDPASDIELAARKVINLRVFEDSSGRMNSGVKEAGKSLLVVSQFTLLGDLRKGRRPSFDQAEAPDAARKLYTRFVTALRTEGVLVEEGEFQAHMEVESVNDGPVTLLLDTRKSF